MGADIVVHSTTKYLNGHSDVVGGAVVVQSDDQNERLRYQQMATGGVPGPLDCWLILRAAKTLHLRMKAHCENARVVADHLEAHPAVDRVIYPGLPSHPQHELARRQMSDFGGMITIDMSSAARAEALATGTRLFALAESLGGVESLISVPALMTHASVPPDRRSAMGLTDGLVRLSVGVEDAEDLVADLDRALAAVA
jgi:cystathionine beta-lyase/cystathionine gamma-synthase